MIITPDLPFSRWLVIKIDGQHCNHVCSVDLLQGVAEVLVLDEKGWATVDIDRFKTKTVQGKIDVTFLDNTPPIFKKLYAAWMRGEYKGGY